jgi:hypothetical protein
MTGAEIKSNYDTYKSRYPSTNCVVSDWGACDGTKRTRTVTQATNGGTACTAEQNVAEQSCNHCIGVWSNCTRPCDTGTQKYTITNTESNGGDSCSINNGSSRNCNTSICSTLSEPPVKGIAGGNGIATGDVEGCGYGCLWLYCYGGIYRIYKLGVKYDHSSFSTIVYNNLSLQFNNRTYDCSSLRFYFNGNYTNSFGTSLVLSAKYQINSRSTSEDWYVVQDNIKLNNAHTFETIAYQNADILDAITVYEQYDYQGAFSRLKVGFYNINQMGIANDVISSIKVPPKLKVTLYEHNNNGRTLVLTSNEPNLGNRNFNNITSSIKVEYIG